MRIILSICLIVFLSSGCSFLHAEELFRLKSAGANMAGQQKYVTAKDVQFEKLLKAIKEDEISEYKTKKDFSDQFGDPIFKKKPLNLEEYSQLWLYRYCDKIYGSEKVYLYFGDAGNLIKWEHRNAKSQ